MEADKITVTMRLTDLNELRDQITDLERKVVALRESLHGTAVGGAAETLQRVLSHALTVAQFAVANMEGLRNLPRDAMRELGKELKTVPGLPQRDLELAEAFCVFADRIPE